MIVESHYAIAIDKLSNWLKNLAPDFQPKSIVCCKSDVYCAWRKLRVIIRNSDWFFSLFAPVVIGRSYYGGGDSYKQILTKKICGKTVYACVLCFQSIFRSCAA